MSMEQKKQKFLMKDIEYPDFKKIIEHAKYNMKLKYKNYGNDWTNFGIDWHWWEKRLKNECNEIKHTGYPFEKLNEIADSIAILSMMYEKAKYEYELEQSVRFQR